MLRNSLFPTLTPFNRPRGLMDLHHHLDQMFEDFSLFPEMAGTRMDVTPRYELTQSDDHYLLSFDIPGVPKDNLKVEVRDNVLFISGQRDDEWKGEEIKTKGMTHSCGRFETALSLPAGIEGEKVEASYRDGVLRVALPRSEYSKPKSVKITEGKEPLWSRLIPHREEKRGKSVDIRSDEKSMH